MEALRTLALRSLWLVAALAGRPPVADAQADTAPVADRGLIDFAEACRRAKAAGLRGRLLEEERTMFAAGGVPSASTRGTSLTAAIIERRRLTAAMEDARAAAEAHCAARNLAIQLPLAERIEGLLSEVRHQLDAVEGAGGVTTLRRTELEQRADESSRRRLEIEARLTAEHLTLTTLVGANSAAAVVVGAGPIVLDAIDAEEEAAAAISRDPELEAIEIVRSCLRRETLPVARRFLSLSDPAVGLPPPAGAVSGHGLRKTTFDTAPMELRLRARQLEELGRRRREAVRLDVSLGVQRLRAATETRDLARAAVDRAVKHRDKLAQLAEGPGVTATSLTLAEIDELAARLQFLEAELREGLAYVQLLAVSYRL